MGLATILSRVLGVVRESLYAAFMGNTPVAAAFKTAFMVPNLFRRLLGEGALTAAFIPIFKEKEKTAGKKEMWEAANAVISGLVVASIGIIALVVLGLTVLLMLTAPYQLAAPGTFSGAAVYIEEWQKFYGGAGWFKPETRLMLELLRLMFPYMLVICLAAIFMGMLNARGHFFIPAMGATILNVIMILIVLFVAPRFGANLSQQVFALGYGVLIAGAAQALYQLPTLYQDGFRYHWISPWRNDTVRTVVRKMVPGMMGVAAFQFNVLTTSAISWVYDPTIYSSFDYAVRLMEFPQGVFGISLATYLLPTLSGLAAEKKFPEFRGTLRQAVGYLSFSNIWAMAMLIVLAAPIVRFLFEHGKFGPTDTLRTSFALVCLAPGLIAFSLVNIFARAFYALGDTTTPMKISCVCLGLNLMFVLWLIPVFQEGGLGIANTMSAFVNVSLLSYGLKRKLGRLDFAPLRNSLLAMAGAVLSAAALAWLTGSAWENQMGRSSLIARTGGVFVPMAVAGVFYFGILLWARVPQAQEIFSLLLAKLTRPQNRKDG